jgi:outer membrane protein insertion porin family
MGVCAPIALAQTTPAEPAPVQRDNSAAPQLKGRTIEAIRVVGNQRTPTAVILNVVRSREGQPFDPATVEEDYQRIYGLKKFSNVEAKVEPTRTGVIVVFSVNEQRQIRSISFVGNVHLYTEDLQNVVEITAGEAIDPFRISLAKLAIENYYHDKNYPFAHVDIPQDQLTQQGELIFKIVEGPNVRIRNVTFRGNATFPASRLADQIATKSWIWIFRPGTYVPEQVEDDVAALRQFYVRHGFFDARVGRKLIWSADMTELQIDFVIEEGRRYTVTHVLFKGNNRLSEAQLRAGLKLTEGQYYDAELLQRDVRQLVRDYSPFGYIYEPQARNEDYLHIQDHAVFLKEPGQVDLVYDIHEGKPFRLGRILVKGNSRTMDKVVLRELRVAPGQMYNSGELQDAAERLRHTPYFSSAIITPIGEDPDSRDVLVEVAEQRTASITFGGGINSNGGVGANITYQQRNFDIANWPLSLRDLFSDRAFTGAGQYFRASFEPGTEATNATIAFGEPWLFDQPYSFNAEAYVRDRLREHYDDNRLGGRVSLGKRFDYVWSANIALRAEDVDISNIRDKSIRAPEIVADRGHSTLTSAGPSIRRNTTDAGFYLSRGSDTILTWDSYGALGGEYDFQKFSGAWDYYITLGEDLLERKTVLGFHANSGVIVGDSPFFERFYGGGIGSVRGFAFRGISPRGGIARDPIGGDFAATASVEVGFPIAGDSFRGVVFADAGDVESNVHFGTIRTSVGAGIRLLLPFLGQAPLAVDFAFPLTKNRDDDTQIISFSFGLGQ